MSLIFESLQKLKSNLNPLPSGPDGAAIQQKHVSFKSYVWLRPILIGLALVLALGCGAVYAVQYIKEHVGAEETNTAIQAQRHKMQLSNRTQVPETVDRPPDAGNRQQPLLQSVMTPPHEERAQFYPPVQKTTDDVLMPATRVVAQNDPSSAAPESVKVKPPALPDLTGPLPKAKSVARPLAQGQPISNSAMEAIERARRKALEKTARIGKLVHRIEQALAGAPDVGDPETLLGQLAHIKGENHPYVMKLRAYWNFQRGAYPAAEADLKKVIAIHPDDLEAGINLALIEIHAQRYADATTRLKSLRHTYPDQAVVADLIKRLK